MSDPGIIQQPVVPPQPALNNVVPVKQAPAPVAANTPPGGGAPASAPNASPSTVPGTQANVSGDLTPLQQMIGAQSASLNVSVDAMKANASINQAASGQLDTVYKDTLAAYDNLQRINRVPQGISNLLGFFDNDWNAKNQALTIQEKNLQAEAITNRSNAQIAINNQLPALAQKQADIAKLGYDAFIDQNKIALQVRGADQEDQRIRLAAVQTRIAMSQEQRAAFEFQVKGLSSEQLQAAIPDAKAGKGPFANQAGLLQERLYNEQQAGIALHDAIAASQEHDSVAANAAMTRFAGNLPAYQLQPLVDQALQTGAPLITLGDPKKPEQQVHIPVPIAEKALADNQALETAARGIITQQHIQDQQIPERLNNAVTAAAALSSADPRAANALLTLSSANAQLGNHPTYEGIQQLDSIIGSTEGMLKNISTDLSKQFSSKDAQAAVLHFGTIGSFTPVGAQAVLGDSLGTFALGRTTKYADAFSTLNTKIAETLAKQDVQGAPVSAASGPNGQIDIQTILAMGQKQSRQRLAQISQELLADPATLKQVAGQMAGTIQASAPADILTGLSAGQHANPIWKEILTNPGQVTNNVNGQHQFDLGKLFTVLERKRVETGGKIDFAGAFLAAAQNYAANSDRSTASDPRYTIYDHALESAVFGDKPHRAALADFLTLATTVAKRQHDDMQRRIGQDLSGATQNAGLRIRDTMPMIGGADPGFGPQNLSLPDNNPTRDTGNIPSSTGANLTADQVRQMFSSGH